MSELGQCLMSGTGREKLLNFSILTLLQKLEIVTRIDFVKILVGSSNRGC